MTWSLEFANELVHPTHFSIRPAFDKTGFHLTIKRVQGTGRKSTVNDPYDRFGRVRLADIGDIDPSQVPAIYHELAVQFVWLDGMRLPGR